MSYTTNQSDFVRNCFQSVLSDGKPHRYREILEYTRQQAQGTEFEGKIEANNMVQAFGILLGSPESEYERVRHGIYQKCAPQTVVQNTAVSEMDGVYGVLDAACALQEQMKAAFEQICEKLPTAQNVLRQDYLFAFDRLDQSIDGISGWLACMEDIADGMAELSDAKNTPSVDFTSMESPSEQIEAFNAMYKPFSIIDYENGFYGASYSFNPEYELTQTCVRAFSAYSIQMGEPPVNSYGLYSHGNGYEWEAVFREAFKDDPDLIQIQFNCEAGGLFYSSENLPLLMDFTKRFVEICNDYDRFAPLIAPGIENWERQLREGEPTLGNLREYMEKYPNGKFTIATPEGIIYLDEEQSRQILSDPNTTIELRGGTFTGQWLLDHDITKYHRDTLDHDYYHVRTNGFEVEHTMEMTM